MFLKQIELNRLIHCINTKRSNNVRHDDIIKVHKTSVSFSTPEEAMLKRK